MAKYCSKCGKELIEGKTCSCKLEKTKIKEGKTIEKKETYSEQGNIIMNFISKPFDTLKEYGKEERTNQSWIILVITAILISFFIVEVQSFTIQNSYLLGFSYPYFRYLIIYSILILASFIFFNVLVQVSTKWLLKTDLSFYKLLDMMAVSLLPISYVTIASLLLMWILGISFTILFIPGIIFWGINYFGQISAIKEVDHNKFIYIFLSSLFIIMLLWMI